MTFPHNPRTRRRPPPWWAWACLAAAAIPPLGADAESHWAFVAPTRPELPTAGVSEARQVSIDVLISGRLEQAGVRANDPAPRGVLLRRLSYDLIGLPPTFAQVEAFEVDANPRAVEQAVDRLLASPQFGERWARHWLDVARYADTKGYVFMEPRDYEHAYTYRDWVVRALNSDLPYDQFVKLQLAADQLGGEADWPAMGFLTLGRRFLNNPHDIIDDRIDVVTRGLMGLTVSCARCHDHKYDPIPTADYYSLYGVFASSQEAGDGPGPLRLVDRDKPQDAHILERGNPARRGPQTPRQFLGAIADDRQPFTNGSGRVELAEAIAHPANPLTARVWVNRVWWKLFGAGLVGTPSDFGSRSDPPLQQDVLDWLAVEFVEHGWSTKWLIREIVLSAAYQRTSRVTDEALAADPENRLLGRVRRRRLDLEAMRDGLLFAAGELEPTVGGPAVKLTEQPFPKRRTVYGKIERQNLPPFYRTFDFASPDTHAPRRYETTVPLQALFLLNSPFMLQQAEALASRVDEELDLPRQVEHFYQQALARDPTPDEQAAALEFLTAESTPSEPFSRRAQLAQGLLMTNEFYFLD